MKFARGKRHRRRDLHNAFHENTPCRGSRGSESQVGKGFDLENREHAHRVRSSFSLTPMASESADPSICGVGGGGTASTRPQRLPRSLTPLASSLTCLDTVDTTDLEDVSVKWRVLPLSCSSLFVHSCSDGNSGARCEVGKARRCEHGTSYYPFIDFLTEHFDSG